MKCPHCQSEVVDDARFCGACGKASSQTESLAGVAPYLTGDVYAAMIGKEIAGRYRIVKKLGEGGMGAVFRAEQMSLKRACAVKLLRPGLASNQQMLRRFNAEAEAVAKLSHPNTVNIYDFGQDTDGTLFIAMEYVEGKSLRDTMQTEGAMPIGRTLAIAAQISQSLADAHAHSIVHRDLKPDNVMLSERGKTKDVVRVLDFGIAKLRDDSRQGQNAMTQAGDMLGTPQYMAPEQIKGETIDGRVDVYALACMMFEMVTGRLCFDAPSVMAMLSKHLVDEVDAPSKRRPDLNIPPAFDAMILAALSKEPSGRPATMELFGEQINALFASLPPDQQRSAASGVMSAGMAAVGPIPTPAPPAFAPPTPPPMGFAPTGAFNVGNPTAVAGPPPGIAGAPPPVAPPAQGPIGTPIGMTNNMANVNPMPPVAFAPDPPKNRGMLYMIIGVAVLLAIIAFMMMRAKDDLKKSGIDIDKMNDDNDSWDSDDDKKDMDDFKREMEKLKHELKNTEETTP